MSGKRTYLVEWKDYWCIYHSDLIKARNKYEAWRKTKRRHPFSVQEFVDITEIR